MNPGGRQVYQMKLFVVGSASLDPVNWSKERDGFGLVIAPDECAARALADKAADCPVREIPLDRPLMLASMFNDPMFYQ